LNGEEEHELVKDENAFLTLNNDAVAFVLPRPRANRYRSRAWRLRSRVISGEKSPAQRGGGTSNEEEESRNPKRGTDLVGSLARPGICKQWRRSARRVLSMAARYASHLHIIAIIR